MTAAPATDLPTTAEPTTAEPSTAPPTTAEPLGSLIHVVSAPPGARVEVGLHAVNSVVTPGTGRMVGTTPLTTPVVAADVDRLANGIADLYLDINLAGYVPDSVVLGLGQNGNLVPGHTYEVNVTLKQLTPASQASYVHVVTTPPGARVEVGLHTVNYVVTSGTGRMVGTSPLTAQLLPADVDRFNGITDLYVDINLAGYYPYSATFGLGQNGNLEPGRTYEINAILKRP